MQRKAAERLKALVDPAVTALSRMLADDAPEASQRFAVKEVLDRDGKIGQVIPKSEDEGLITYEQLEIIVRRRQAQRGKEAE